MSDTTNQASSSSSAPNNDTTITPIFFNLHHNQPSSDKKEEEMNDNPNWLQPPPPYSSVIHDEASESSAPSAPPLELVYDEQPQQNEPRSNDSLQTRSPENASPTNYGSIHSPEAPVNNKNIKYSWRKFKAWIFTPRNAKHDGSQFFRIFISVLFASIFILLAFQYFSTTEESSCYDGVKWTDLPDSFNYTKKGLRIKTVGGEPSGGLIAFRKDEKKAGTVDLTVLISPPNLIKDPELGFGFTRLYNGSTMLELFIPQSTLLSRRHCVFLQAVVYLPNDGPLELFDGMTPNTLYSFGDDTTLDITTLAVETSNKRIDLDSAWKGDLLSLKTKNAPITIGRSITEGSIVELETTNGAIRIRDTVNLSSTLLMSTKNDDIITESKISVETFVSYSINGQLRHYEIEANRAEVKTSNDLVEVEHGNITRLLNIQTINAKLKLNLDTCSKCIISATTVNADLVVSLPKNYEGQFTARTKSKGKIGLSDCIDWTQIRHLDEFEVSGIRYSHNNTNRIGGDVTAQTYEGDVYLSFGNNIKYLAS